MAIGASDDALRVAKDLIAIGIKTNLAMSALTVHHGQWLADIARAQEISVELARQWNYRGKFPPPDYVMGKRPGWKRSTLEKAGVLKPIVRKSTDG